MKYSQEAGKTFQKLNKIPMYEISIMSDSHGEGKYQSFKLILAYKNFSNIRLIGDIILDFLRRKNKKVERIRFENASIKPCKII